MNQRDGVRSNRRSTASLATVIVAASCCCSVLGEERNGTLVISAREAVVGTNTTQREELARLMLYLPCQTPNAGRRAQRAFGLPEGRQDQPINEEFAHKWAKVIHEWSSRYGDKVAGWWFDGGYQRIQFNEAIARIYADAVKRGNPKAIVTFNPGVRLVRHTRAEDYTAGELNEPFDVPK